jgi:hypothetical protein
MNWDEWRGSLDSRPTMFIKRLLHVGGFRIDLHKIIRADDAQCFHTHPAYAVRIILWGGYEEQVLVGNTGIAWHKFWRPGSIGIIKPAYCHRVSAILNRAASYSFWLRAPATHTVELRGEGWKGAKYDPLAVTKQVLK